MAENDGLKAEERVIFKLRALFQAFGYQQYRMSRFEEYDFYAGKKDFLVGGDIITFTDRDGKLMALKPDVTLSIVKSVPDGDGVSRICYGENVYRVSEQSGRFREIMQTGLECIGNLGLVEVSEVAVLAQMSLKTISKSCVLTISHMGIVESLLAGVPEGVKSLAIGYLSGRNVSALNRLAQENVQWAKDIEKVSALAMMFGPFEEILGALREMGADEVSVGELEAVVSQLDPDVTRIDFSLLDGMKYYNGVTFRGFVEGVPTPVLSGGQYDKLMRRMKKKSSAIGFAVYMDALERLLQDRPEYDVDVVLLYNDTDSVALVLDKAQTLRNQGFSVVTLKEVPKQLRFRKVVRSGEDV